MGGNEVCELWRKVSRPLKEGGAQGSQSQAEERGRQHVCRIAQHLARSTGVGTLVVLCVSRPSPLSPARAHTHHTHMYVLTRTQHSTHTTLSLNTDPGTHLPPFIAYRAYPRRKKHRPRPPSRPSTRPPRRPSPRPKRRRPPQSQRDRREWAPMDRQVSQPA